MRWPDRYSLTITWLPEVKGFLYEWFEDGFIIPFHQELR